jgi:hypothetical protein
MTAVVEPLPWPCTSVLIRPSMPLFEPDPALEQGATAAA